MNDISCSAWIVLGYVLKAFWIAMLLYALVSWVPNLQGRWSEYIARVVEPVLIPMRRIIPPIGGLDISFLIVIVIVGWVMRSIPPAYCYYR